MSIHERLYEGYYPPTLIECGYDEEQMIAFFRFLHQLREENSPQGIDAKVRNTFKFLMIGCFAYKLLKGIEAKVPPTDYKLSGDQALNFNSALKARVHLFLTRCGVSQEDIKSYMRDPKCKCGYHKNLGKSNGMVSYVIEGMNSGRKQMGQPWHGGEPTVECCGGYYIGYLFIMRSLFPDEKEGKHGYYF